MSKAASRQLSESAPPEHAMPHTTMPLLARQRCASLWRLRPMAALLLGEVLAIALLAPPRAGELHLGSVALALAVLCAGIVPALLRPSAATNLVGCSVVVLAVLVWRGPPALSPLTSFHTFALALDANDIR